MSGFLSKNHPNEYALLSCIMTQPCIMYRSGKHPSGLADIYNGGIYDRLGINKLKVTLDINFFPKSFSSVGEQQSDRLQHTSSQRVRCRRRPRGRLHQPEPRAEKFPQSHSGSRLNLAFCFNAIVTGLVCFLQMLNVPCQ